VRLPIYQVDAFADAVFAGNPAAVVPLDAWLPDATMQAIAMENALSETAFLVPDGEGWELRWFTPAVEVALCGHATLATAHVLSTRLAPGRARYDFRTRRSGTVSVAVDGDLLTLDFPVIPPVPGEAHAGLLDALGGGPAAEILRAEHRVLVVYDDPETVRRLEPRIDGIPGPERTSALVTAAGGGEGIDFVSRYFTPAAGIPEDPVTGSAHCALVPYWARRLGKTALEARQLSRRGGALSCRLAGARVLISGRAVLYMEGTIHV